MSKASEPFEPLISHWKRVAAAEREPRRLDRPDRAVLELDRRLDRVVDLPARAGTSSRSRRPSSISPIRKRARSTTCVPRSPSAPEPASLGIEAPRVERRIVAPVLQVAAAEVADLPQLARLDHLAREPDRRHEAVVERAQVLDAGRGDRAARSRSSRRRRARAASRRSRACPPRRRRSSARRAASSGRRCRRGRSGRRRRARASRRSRTRSRSGVAASSTASAFRPAIPTSLGSSGGGHVMYAIFLNAFEWALPMNA